MTSSSGSASCSVTTDDGTASARRPRSAGGRPGRCQDPPQVQPTEANALVDGVARQDHPGPHVAAVEVGAGELREHPAGPVRVRVLERVDVDGQPTGVRRPAGCRHGPIGTRSRRSRCRRRSPAASRSAVVTIAICSIGNLTVEQRVERVDHDVVGDRRRDDQLTGVAPRRRTR